MFTAGEYDLLHEYRQASFIIAAVISAAVLSVWLRDAQKRQQVFVVSYGAVLAVCSTIQLIFEQYGRGRFCHNASNAVDGTDGITVCSVEASVLVYSLLFYAWSFCLQSVLLLRRIALRVRQPADVTKHVYVLLGVPMLFSLALLLTGSYHHPLGGLTCSAVDSQESQLPTLLFTLPFFAFIFIGILCSCVIVVMIFRLALEPAPVQVARSGNGNGASLWSMVGTSLRFLLFSGLFVLAVMLLGMYFVATSEERKTYLQLWGTCVLTNFDGVTEHHLVLCGAHPYHQNSISALCWLLMCGGAGLAIAYLLVNFRPLWTWAQLHVLGVKVEPLPYIEQQAQSMGTSEDSQEAGILGPGVPREEGNVQGHVGTQLSVISENPFSGSNSEAFGVLGDEDFTEPDLELADRISVSIIGIKAYISAGFLFSQHRTHRSTSSQYSDNITEWE